MANITLKDGGENEIVIKKSRFITSLARVSSATEAEEFVASIRSANRKANHNVWAARIGWPVFVERASDDGEPSGTAGSPTLRGLTVHNVSNAVAVTTRYFGGIKLGASGLIRAYTDSVTEAIKKVGLVELVPEEELLITTDYATYQVIDNYFRNAEITITASFTEQVTISAFLDEAQRQQVQADLTELTSGKATFAAGAARTAERPIAFE
ncbi:YigZ family protein [Lacticaseibacillus hulanensis]|uniref:YigZ family protein n=1 Tax=Lacticaseibacillus hulanensis TaxID=2493111 RepID=UPI000FDA0170|nr:YigZ family protein [Lacticaseibacillus hulanensis]